MARRQAQKGTKKGPAKSAPRKASSAPSRARGAKKGPGRPRTPATKKPAKKATPTKRKPSAKTKPAAPLLAVPLRGRPKDSPDVWTPEHLEEVAQQLWEYIEKTACPTEAEFCITYLVRHQRLGEFPILRELKEFMFAKRQAYTVGEGISLGLGDGPRGSFLAKLAANAGPFSLIDKGESIIRGPGSAFENLSDDELEKTITDEITRRSRG